MKSTKDSVDKLMKKNSFQQSEIILYLIWLFWNWLLKKAKKEGILPSTFSEANMILPNQKYCIKENYFGLFSLMNTGTNTKY